MPAEVVFTLATAADERMRAILVAGFGGSGSELRALRLPPLRPPEGNRDGRGAIDKRGRRKDPKTSSRRVVALPRFVLDALDAHIMQFAGGDPNGPLFPGVEGSVMSDGWFKKHWTKARAAVGLKGVRFHDLRHTAGTLATQNGATLKEVMTRLGHSTTAAAIRYQRARTTATRGSGSARRGVRKRQQGG